MAEDVVAKYILDVSDLKAKVSEIERQYKKTETAAASSAKKASESIKTEFKGVSSTIEDIGATVIAAFSIEKLFEFGKKTAEAFIDADKASRSLAFGVTSVLGGTTEQVKELREQGKLLSEQTFFSQTEITKSQSLLTNLGLTSEQIKKLLPQILNLAATPTFNNDATAATDAVIQAIEGRGLALKRLGIQINSTGTESERLADLTQKLTKFDGAATEAQSSLAGQIKLSEKNLEEMEVEIGQRTAPILVKLKEVAIQAALGLAQVFFPKPGAEKVVDDINHISDALQSVIAKTPTEKLLDQAAKFDAQLQDLQSKRDAFLQKSAESTKSSGDKDFFANSALKVIDQINVLIGKQAALNAEIKKRSGAGDEEKKQNEILILQKENLIGLSKEELQAEIDKLQARKDSSTIDIRSEITRRTEQLAKAEEAEKKSQDQRLKDAAAAFEDLLKLQKSFEEKSKESQTVSESERLEKERQFILNEAKLKLIASGGNVDDAGNGTGNLDAVAHFKAAELAINKFYDSEITKAALKEAEDRAKQLSAIDKQTLDKALSDLQATLTAIDNDTTRKKSTISIDFSKRPDIANPQTQKQLNDQLADEDKKANDLKIAEANATAKDLEKLGFDSSEARLLAEKLLTGGLTDEAKKQIQIAEDAAAKRARIAQEIISTSEQIVSSLVDISNNFAQGQIDALEGRTQAIQSQADAEQSVVEEKFKNQLISERNYRSQSDAIANTRIESEKKIQKQINELKKKQDTARRAESIFESIVNTAVAVTNALKDSPFLAAIVAALGAAEIAVILSTPLPKYELAKGTLKVEGNEKGKDSVHAMLMPEESVIPVRETKDYFKTVKAIFHREVSEKELNHFVDVRKELAGKNIDQDFANDLLSSLGFKVQKDLNVNLGGVMDNVSQYKTTQLIQPVIHQHKTEQHIQYITERNEMKIDEAKLSDMISEKMNAKLLNIVSLHLSGTKPVKVVNTEDFKTSELGFNELRKKR